MWYFRAVWRRVLRPLRGELAGREARILDAGCGTGGLLNELRRAEVMWEPEGLDYSPVACALARERTGLPVRQGSMTALPHPDGAFDAVVSVDALTHVQDRAAALAEMVRVLRPGGLVILNVPAYRWLWSYHDEAVQTTHRYTRPELRTEMAAAGLTVEHASYANMLALPLVWIRRKLLRPRNPTSDVRVYPWPVERIFAGMAAAEFAWTGTGRSLPAGSSVFTVGRKQR